MDFNIGAALAATVVMFAVGGVWYMGIFAKMWGEMFGFDKLSKKEQKVAQAKMMPWMALQVAMTALSAFVIAGLESQMPTVSLYRVVFMIWLGFVVPTIVSGVVFGGTEPKWIVRKIFIQVGESLAHLLAAAWVITLIAR